MTWLGQVLHVARKDLREEVWPFGAYFAVIALASFVAFTRAFAYSGVLAYVVALLGTILAAAVVQSDSPTASDAFWGSRPFSPTAMLCAKVLLAAIIVLIPSIGQRVALSAFDAGGREAFLAIAHSSRIFVVWLLAAMAIAALTRDVRTFVLSFAAIFAALLFVQTLWYDFHNQALAAPLDLQNPDAQAILVAREPISLGGPRLWTAISVSGAVALLVFLYQRRDTRRRMWIAGIAVMASTALGAFMSEPIQARATSATSVTSVTNAARIPIRVELQRSERLGKDDQMNLRVAAAGDSGSRRLLLYVDRVTIRLRDGRAVIVRGSPGSNAIVAAGNPFGANIRWLRDETDFFSMFSLALSPEQRAAIATGFTGLELAGTVSVLEPRRIAALPIEPHRSMAADGRRLQILSVTPAPDGGTLSVQSTSAIQTQSPLPFDRLRAYTSRQYAFVNEARGEAIYPFSTGISSGPNTLVLPSMPLVNETATLQMKTFAGTVRGAAWFMGARLALIEWTRRGTYDVRIPIAEVPTPPELRPRDSTIQRSGNQLERLDAVPRP